jgi:beta-phosphoglucomutase-like phosphatase (HAD superfamily)
MDVVNFGLGIAPPDALFFDVDGVLIDSLAIKGEALAETFRDFPNSRQIVIDFHQANGGLTRTRKISMLYRLLAGADASKREIQERSARFGETVQQRVVAADEILGAEAALRWWAPKCPLYAVSATPSAELGFVLAARGIVHFFRGIRGWPPAKDKVISELLTEHGYAAQRCVLIGDSREDLLASRRSGVQFIHVCAPPNEALPGQHPTIGNLQALNSAISITVGDQYV